MQETLDYVLKNTFSGNPESVIQCIDDYVKQSGKFLMNVGPEKGNILKKEILRSKPVRVLELGSFIGYSAILIASNIANGSKLISIDIDSKSIEISKKMVTYARLDHKIQFIEGSATEVIPSLEDSFDFVFIDHGKKSYLKDLLLLEQHSLLNQNAVVFADNVGIFETELKKYLNHVRNSKIYQSSNIASKLEYRDNIYDAVEISIYRQDD
tara:strand:+ start:1675 stop:2307 length:633 start_codon:yes stop_codon:yes gene_type:complete